MMMEQPSIPSLLSQRTKDASQDENGAENSVNQCNGAAPSITPSNSSFIMNKDSSPVDAPVTDHSVMKNIVGAVSMSRGSREILPEQDDFHPQDDIYSLLFITPFSIFNGAFLYCIFFLAFQGIVIALIGADLLANGTPNNWLDVPHGVGLVVSVSQVFALFIATITQQDVVTSLYLASGL